MITHSAAATHPTLSRIQPTDIKPKRNPDVISTVVVMCAKHDHAECLRIYCNNSKNLIHSIRQLRDPTDQLVTFEKLVNSPMLQCHLLLGEGQFDSKQLLIQWNGRAMLNL